MLPYFQLNGHHNAELDPLGISCINFDDAPVATGVQNVGEKCSLTAVRDNNELVCINVAFPISSLFFSLLSISFQIPFNTYVSTLVPPPHHPPPPVGCFVPFPLKPVYVDPWAPCCSAGPAGDYGCRSGLSRPQ